MARIIRSLICLSLILSMILALGFVPALASGIPAWINNSDATVYTSTGQAVSLDAGTSVEVTATKDGWAQFTCKGNTGYVKIKYLTAKEGITAYVKKSTYVYKSASTSSKKAGPLAVGTELKVVGFDGSFCQVTNGKVLAYIPKSALSKTKPSADAYAVAKTAAVAKASAASKVKLVSWSSGKNLVSKRGYAYIYDIKSGLSIRVRRLGGSNHMEMEPLTADDTENLKKIGGGKFSWDSHPVILYNGSKYVAAAINTMPHGEQSIKTNNFDGQFCLHLLGSKTHGSNEENSNHQAAVKYAYAWALSKS